MQDKNIIDDIFGKFDGTRSPNTDDHISKKLNSDVKKLRVNIDQCIKKINELGTSNSHLK